MNTNEEAKNKSRVQLEKEKLIAERDKLRNESKRLLSRPILRSLPFWTAITIPAAILSVMIAINEEKMTEQKNLNYDLSRKELILKKAEDELFAIYAGVATTNTDMFIDQTKQHVNVATDICNYNLVTIGKLLNRISKIDSSQLPKNNYIFENNYRKFIDSVLLKTIVEIDDLNKILVPLIKNNPNTSSMMIVGEGGFEFVILDLTKFESKSWIPKARWMNRIMWNQQWGQKAFEFYSFSNNLSKLDTGRFLPDMSDMSKGGYGKLYRQDGPKIKYNPTKRNYAEPWFYPKGSNELSKRFMLWTEPTIFYTTRTPGVTASKVLRGDSSLIILAVDFTLTELSNITLNLRHQESTITFMLSEDGYVLGFPYSKKYRDLDSCHNCMTMEDTVIEYLYTHSRAEIIPDQVPPWIHIDTVAHFLNIPQLHKAYVQFKDKIYKDTSIFSVDFILDKPFKGKTYQERWYGLFRRTHPLNSEEHYWIGTIAREEDFSLLGY